MEAHSRPSDQTLYIAAMPAVSEHIGKALQIKQVVTMTTCMSRNKLWAEALRIDVVETNSTTFTRNKFAAVLQVNQVCKMTT